MAALQEFGVASAPTFDRRSPVRWVAAHVWRYPALPLIFMLTVTGMAMTQSLSAVFVGRAFDAVASGAGLTGLVAAALGVIAAWLGYGLCDIGNSWSVRFLAQRVERDAREELYLSLLGKSQSFHGRHAVGELMARATNSEAAGAMSAGTLASSMTTKEALAALAEVRAHFATQGPVSPTIAEDLMASRR
ncbi:MAG: hypothetical protein AB4911_04380 [Oscillochloridaceae bacterium umkhey_bin13]